MFWRKRKEGPVDIVHRYIAALNARDADVMKAMLHPDCRFVDSHGFCVDGHEDSKAAVDAFLGLAEGFRLHVTSSTMRGDDILLRGHTEANDPRLATDTLWLARVADGKMQYWQSFGGADAPPLAHLLLPDRAKAAPQELRPPTA
ncbi:MAG: nuclear transport factor 2 family protein [Alteraurantiacibacter sp.]